MTQLFLGHYLLREGIVTRAQLDRAIALQLESNHRLGDLAVEAGLLTPEQVRDILDAQRGADRSFGELAVTLGHVSRKAMGDLIFRQQVRQVHLGEALLALGFLSQEQFSRVLQDYTREEAARRDVLAAVLGPVAECAVIHRLVAALERAFPRFVGCPLKALGELTGRDLARMEFAYGCHARLPGGEALRYTLHLSARMLELLGEACAAKPPTGGAGVASAAPGEAVRGVLETICRHLCRVLSRGALAGSAGAAPAGEVLRSFRVRLASPEADMGLTASLVRPVLLEGPGGRPS